MTVAVLPLILQEAANVVKSRRVDARDKTVDVCADRA